METLNGHTGPIHCINTRHHMICSGGADFTVRVSCEYYHRVYILYVTLLIGCSYGIQRSLNVLEC